ncbi:MAG: type II toxin-antitoxin system CcdA family antitoxin [Rhodospirillales bacterium]|nr:type II toxin-antitoxin system CcdA family antitoxin [Acetobacter sp.]
MGLRLDPALIAEVRAQTDNLAAAIEEGLRLWLKREAQRKKRATEMG